jgi:signal transduction histidine kinase
LIDNAIKYTVKGEVIIRCRKEKEYLTIEVKDTGIGIAKKYQPNIFNLFTQESSGYTRRFDGNGLGLFIAKGYADILGIELFFESKKNIGTTFFIKFPLS